jgi:predicted alpha/beta-hydrolase family hydrolase
MVSEQVIIPLSAGRVVSGAVCVPDAFEAGRTPALIVAHGAGNDMRTPLLEHFSAGLCRSGVACLRFNFRYIEQGRRAPDPQHELVRTWQAVFRFAQAHPGIGASPIVIGGKSMGGRIASHATAEGLLAPAGLVFLGYPLHPAGKPDRLRDAHLYTIRVPMLFFAGTRDALCGLDLLRAVIGRIRVPAALEIIAGGDHSFCPPKSAAATIESICDRIVDRTVSWIRQTLEGALP